MIWNLPNILTLIRFILSFLLLWALLVTRWSWALWLFLVGSATDMIDGALARLLHQKTRIGAFLDPMADKLLLFFAFLLLTIHGWIPVWITSLVILRDLMITGGIFFLHYKKVRVDFHPTLVSKANTFCQMLVLTIALMNAAYQTGDLVYGYDRLLVGLLTVISGVQYFQTGLRFLREARAT